MNLKFGIQLMNNKSRTRMNVRDMVICGIFAAVLFVAQIALAVLPNIEIVSLLVIVYTLVFERKTIPIIYAFALLEGLVYGFGIWWIMYLYVWTILYAIVRCFRNNENALFWAVIGGFYGLGYGVLCSIPYFLTGGTGVGIAWWIRGIPYDIIHGVGNFIVIFLLFKPIYISLKKMYYRIKNDE